MQVSPKRTAAFAAAVTVAAVVLRLAFRNATNEDLVNFFVPWYDYIVDHGGYRALADAFTNYTPPYTYLLTLITYLPISSKLLAIKAIAIPFDFVAAATMYFLVRRRYPEGAVPWFGYAAVLFAPTVLVNSSYWGQSDAIYGSGLLLFTFLTLSNRPVSAWLALALAFAFKLQALFIGPLLAVLIWRRRQPWYLVGLVPLVYLLAVLPAALLGRPLADMLTIYPAQAATYPRLWMGAANFYLFAPNRYYDTGLLLGLGLAGLGMLTFFILVTRSRQPLTDDRILLVATLSLMLLPFLLPKMHERYFYAADLFTIALAFYRPRLWFVPVLLQLSSISAYGPFLWRNSLLPLRLLPFISLAVIVVLAVVLVMELYPRADRTLRLKI